MVITRDKQANNAGDQWKPILPYTEIDTITIALAARYRRKEALTRALAAYTHAYQTGTDGLR